MPCQHMVVVVKSTSIEGLSRIQIMPYWWTTTHWRAQYPLEVNCRANVSMTTVKGKYHPDELLHYCPSWAAVKKKGRPKTTQHQKSVSNHIQESLVKKRKRRLWMFCWVCHKFNHNSEYCYKNPLNKWKLGNIDLDRGDNDENRDGKEELA